MINTQATIEPPKIVENEKEEQIINVTTTSSLFELNTDNYQKMLILIITLSIIFNIILIGYIKNRKPIDRIVALYPTEQFNN